MSLRYVDRTGCEISEAEWRDFQGDERYRVLEEHRERGVRVDLSWVGVWLDRYELAPRPFIVDVTRINGGGPRQLPRCRFYAKETDAKDAFHRMVGELFGRDRRTAEVQGE